jgi:hypothetical protein
MLNEEALQIKPGDQVTWHDSDQVRSLCQEFGSGPFSVLEIRKFELESGLEVAVCIPDLTGRLRRIHPEFLKIC